MLSDMPSGIKVAPTPPVSVDGEEKDRPSSYHTVGSRENDQSALQSSDLEDQSRSSPSHGAGPPEGTQTAVQSAGTDWNDGPSLSHSSEENVQSVLPATENEKGNGTPPPSPVIEEDDDIQYPEKLAVALVMSALYLSGFLVALVKYPVLQIRADLNGLANTLLGSDHHRHSYSSHY